METYKNDYTQEEDLMMWELHEIRNEIQLENMKKSIEEINQQATEIFEQWKSEYGDVRRKAI